MLNSKPNNKKYHQGNYIAKNKDKIYKLNNEGGNFYKWVSKNASWCGLIIMRMC